LAALPDPVLAFAGGAFFQGMVHFVADPTGLLDRLAHGKDQAGNRHLRPLLEMKAVNGMMSYPVAAAWFAEVGMTFAGVDEDDGDLGLVAVALPNHFGGGAKLAGGAVDGGGGSEAAEFEFKNGGGMPVGKGNSIQLPEPVTTAEMVAEFGILVPENPPVPEIETTSEEGADTKLRGGTNNGKGGGFNADLAGTLAFPAPANGEALRPPEVFAVVGMDEFRFPVIGGGSWRVRVQGKTFMASWRRPHSRLRRCTRPKPGCQTRTIHPRR